MTRRLPECRYADRATRHAGLDDWRITLLDPIYRLPADYAPERLVSTTRAGLQAGYEVRPEVVDDLRAMAEASREVDAEIAVRWAYRSYREQAGAFAYWMRQAGYQRALEISARPGHSEHQLGTSLDFRSADSLRAPWDYEDWGVTPAGTWMRENSWRFGFVLSYPRGMSDETCYDYEPWHFRYVGRELAAAVHDSGVSLRRYLWENFEAAVSGR
ncbi:MAG: M15 family metallopeptidase [Chloroflexota bacterium]|nr:M15 family metallopeptidase [Chloroflexota bacterium]